MATLGNLENKPVLVSEMRNYVGNISAHARGGNTLKATKTGALVSVDDAYAGALLGLTVYGNSVQDGTPTPESPVPIKSVAGAYAIMGASPNLWGGVAMKNAYQVSVSGATLGSDDHGEYVAHTAAATNKRHLVEYIFKENTAYTLILDFKKSAGVGSNVRIYYTDGTYATVAMPSDTADVTVPQTVVVTTDPSKTVSYITKFNSSGTSYIYYNTSGLFEGVLTAADFVPFVGSSTPLTLIDDQGVAHELRSLGDYRDELHINADGSGTLYRKVVDFQYTSDYIGSNEISGGKYRFVQNVNYQAQGLRTGNAANLAKSNMLPHEDTPVSDASYSFNNSGTAQYVNVVLPSSVASSVTEFRAWLATHDLHIYFVEKTPSAYHIPAINMPSLPDLVSNAWISATDADGAAIACECSIEYRRDINKVIGDIEEAIADIVAQ